MSTHRLDAKQVRYTHTTFEWNKSPYGSVPDRVTMVQHFMTDPTLDEFTVELEVGE